MNSNNLRNLFYAKYFKNQNCKLGFIVIGEGQNPYSGSFISVHTKLCVRSLCVVAFLDFVAASVAVIG